MLFSLQFNFISHKQRNAYSSKTEITTHYVLYQND